MTTDQSLSLLFSRRAWYKGSGINESTARVYKKRFLEQSLKLETRIKILRAAGFRLKQEMKWEYNHDPRLIRKDMIARLKKINVFWSYDPANIQQITDDILTEKVLMHLDIEDVPVAMHP